MEGGCGSVERDEGFVGVSRGMRARSEERAKEKTRRKKPPFVSWNGGVRWQW